MAAVSWAMRVQSLRSSTKFVLVAMCNYADEYGECYPSAKQIELDTCQDSKTVAANLRLLRDMGLIVDTGARRGSTLQVIVYRIVPSATVVAPGGKKAGETPPKTDVLNTPVFPVNTPKFPVKHPQISGETPPKTGGGTVMEPSRNRQECGNRADAPAISELPDVPQDVLLDWLAVRKAKRAGPLTATVIAGLRREADKAGISLADAVAYCCEAGWQGFNAVWYASRTSTVRGGGGGRIAAGNKNASAFFAILEG